MKTELILILNKEMEALKQLLEFLDVQYKLIMEKKVFELEDMVEKIKGVNRVIAEVEVERRRITKGESMKKIVDSINDEELTTLYRELNKLISLLQFQKDTNEMLLKQQISFNNQILRYITPKKEATTYNSYGNIRG